ncbi:MAG: hypothetical protein WBD55_03080 [Dehalococcoidia bacterium]
MNSVLEKFGALSIGEKIIIVAGAVLFIDGFLPWYSIDLGVATFSRNGWQSPGAIWSILAVLIGLAMAGAVIVKGFTDVVIPDNVGGLSWPRLHLGAGVATVLLVLIKWVNENDYLGFAFYLGLIAAVALAVAGALMFREEQAS